MFSTIPGVLLLFFLTQTLGIEPALAGAVVMLPKLWDVASDPLAGWLLGRLPPAYGRHIPMAVGTVVMPLAFAAMFNPVFDHGIAQIGSVATAYVLAATGYTLFAVPYVTLAAELADNSVSRVRLVEARTIGVMAGVLIAAGAAPAAVSMLGGGRAAYGTMALASAAIMFAAMAIPTATVWRAGVAGRRRTDVARHRSASWLNKSFLALCLTNGLLMIVVGIYFAGLPYIAQASGIDPERATGLVLAGVLIIAILATPVWRRIAERRGTPFVLASANVLLGLAACSLLGFALFPGLALALGGTFVLGLAFSAVQLGPYGMLADLISEQANADSATVLTGILTAIEKVGLAFGPFLVALALPLASPSREVANTGFLFVLVLGLAALAISCLALLLFLALGPMRSGPRNA
ncbi:MAG: MFS transporter [Erythrobacter sp.]|nr:MFS transporter [Erythrobacter sp.]MBO6530236.1 MFS transporter [Erythrobacter sp.]